MLRSGRAKGSLTLICNDNERGKKIGMKKFLVLVLAFMLAFALAAPAMAFTSDEQDNDDTPYSLDIYLVEYDDDDLFGYVSLPPTDRGYAKNEIVAAVVELDVPEDEDPEDDYGFIEFGGDHVSLDVSDNDNGKLACAGFDKSTDKFTYDDDEDVLARDVDGDFLNTTKDKTYKWLFFAKVTGDDASLYAKMVDGDKDAEFKPVQGESSNSNDLTLTLTLSGDDYDIVKHFDGGDVDYYTIEDEDGNIVYLYVNDKYKTTGMAIDLFGDSDDDGAIGPIALGVNTSGVLGVVEGAKILTSGHKYDDVMDVYEDVCQDVFDFDYYNIGNYLRDSFFENMVSAHTIIATVDIKPWAAYVTIPDAPDIIVDPPKTGDAASILGFVMVALSGAGAVALKKRG